MGDERDEFDMTQSIRKKEKAVKASFKIEITDEERKLRDSQVTNVYHTGNASTQGTSQGGSFQVGYSAATTATITLDK